MERRFSNDKSGETSASRPVDAVIDLALETISNGIELVDRRQDNAETLDSLRDKLLEIRGIVSTFRVIHAGTIEALREKFEREPSLARPDRRQSEEEIPEPARKRPRLGPKAAIKASGPEIEMPVEKGSYFPVKGIEARPRYGKGYSPGDGLEACELLSIPVIAEVQTESEQGADRPSDFEETFRLTTHDIRGWQTSTLEEPDDDDGSRLFRLGIIFSPGRLDDPYTDIDKSLHDKV